MIQNMVSRWTHLDLSLSTLSMVIRWFIVAGAWFRFVLDWNNYTFLHLILWLLTLIIFSGYALVITYQQLSQPSLENQTKWHLSQVLADTVLISMVYLLTTRADSDFFLFYFLPLLIAVEHFEDLAGPLLLILVTVLYGAIFLILTFYFPEQTPVTIPPEQSLLRNFLPRWAFIMFLLLGAFARQRLLKARNQELEESTGELKKRSEELEAAHEQVQKQTEAIQILNAAGRAMNATLNTDKTFRAIVENACKLMSIYNSSPPIFACLLQIAGDGNSLKPVAAHPPDQFTDIVTHLRRIDLTKQPIGVVGKVVEEKASKCIADVSTEREYYIPYHPETRSQLAVPIRNERGGEITGVISVEHADLNAFPVEAQENLEGLAVLAAAAIENAQLFKEIGLQSDEAKMLLRINYDSVSGVADSILQALFNFVPYERATLHRILEDGTRKKIAKRGYEDASDDPFWDRPVPQDRLVQKILNSKKVCILSPPQGDEDWDRRPETDHIKSWIGIPLVYGDQPVGFVTLEQIQEDFYTEKEHAKLLDLFAQHATSVLQNAILFEQNAMLLQQSEDRVDDLTQAKETLETALDFFEGYYNLALIGLVYGESIHYAENELGMALTRAHNIAEGYVDDPSAIKEYASGIMNYIQRYQDVLYKIRQAALRNPTHSEMNVHHMLDQIVTAKRRSRGISIKREYLSDSPVVYAPKQLRQVFLVVIQNAFDAMGGQGVLTLKTERTTRDGVSFLRVGVSDTGKGIPDRLQKDLFTWKMQDSSLPKRHGTGMGLPWASAFMRMYRGNIEFTSRPGHTTMSILVPEDFEKVLPLPLDPEETRQLITRLAHHKF
ncbi:MAG: GAF domain-containing protein [Chloroflexota bacterium]|nr:GAF domain-containing protein [Chloroflexota bacterium]MDQ5866641.1 GAF domain-containing protein [Chloroflexota bacterium]